MDVWTALHPVDLGVTMPKDDHYLRPTRIDRLVGRGEEGGESERGEEKGGGRVLSRAGVVYSRLLWIDVSKRG